MKKAMRKTEGKYVTLVLEHTGDLVSQRWK